MEAIARICLGEDAPEAVVRLLALSGVHMLPAAEAERSDLCVDFAGGESSALSGARRVRVQLLNRPGKARRHVQFACQSPHAVASFILSSALGLATPFLTADARTFAALGMALGAGRGLDGIVVQGETGTGKELLVRMLHAASRREGRLVTVNRARLDERFLKNEEPTEGTSACGGTVDADGILGLRRAAGGSLFLDQVAELTPPAQWLLVHALREGRASGGAEDADQAPSLTRVLSATSRPLDPMVAANEFRRDLKELLAKVTVVMLPLRERPDDIVLLARYFLYLAGAQLRFGPGALRALAAHPFPGNVRELSNLITRLSLERLALGNDVIEAADVQAALRSSGCAPASAGPRPAATLPGPKAASRPGRRVERPGLTGTRREARRFSVGEPDRVAAAHPVAPAGLSGPAQNVTRVQPIESSAGVQLRIVLLRGRKAASATSRRFLGCGPP